MWINNTQKQLAQGVLKHGVEILEHAETAEDLSQYAAALEKLYLDYPLPPQSVDTAKWFVPYKYQTLDIEQHCLDLCQTQQQIDRVNQELTLYRQHNMLIHLKTMKYIVDTLRENDVVWGVGRGSSVASYCLYLLGVHKIDSIKYDLPLEEFFK